jgi:hypothetical protein
LIPDGSGYVIFDKEGVFWELENRLFEENGRVGNQQKHSEWRFFSTASLSGV